MHPHFKRAVIKLLALVLGTTGFVSFTSPTGADRFEIYLNKKLVFQQYVSMEASSPKSFQLDRNNYSGEIDVVYSHCGAPGKNRNIKITDAKNNLIREWSFGDGKNDKAAMTVMVKDILLAQKEHPVSRLNIYYSSEQIPKGRLLAAINLVDNNARP